MYLFEISLHEIRIHMSGIRIVNGPHIHAWSLCSVLETYIELKGEVSCTG